jgi:hypothetical protein
MDETTYEFSYTIRDRFGLKRDVSISLHGDQSWMDLAEAFGNYLSAVGFNFDIGDLAEALDSLRQRVEV